MYLRRLLGLLPAIVGGSLMVLDPFLFGHSTLLATDAPLAIFAFGSVVYFLGYIRFRYPIDLLISALFGGLAVLSKITGLFLMGFVCVVLLVEGWRRRGTNWLWRAFGVGIAWSAVLVVVCFLLWPALWTAPVSTLRSLLTFTARSAEGAINSNTFFMGEMIPGGDLGGWQYLHYYPLTILWRTTPVILLGLGFTCAAGSHFLIKKKPLSPKAWMTLWLVAYVVLFTGLMSLSSKKFDRYLLPVYPALAVLAGIGWAWAAKFLGQRWKSGSRWQSVGMEKVSPILLLVAVIGGSWSLLQRSLPAPLNAYNPLMGTAKEAAEVFVIGWGEGLEQAAEYLNQQENAKMLDVYSWYAAALNVQFVGRAKDLPISQPIDDDWLAEMLAADYVVVYAHQYQRQTSQRLLDAIADQTPVFIVSQDGVKWVRVYDMHALNLAP